MTFRQMEIFVAVCQHQSITTAAEHSMVSPQAVSRTIKDLEKELDCHLVERTKEGVFPTEIGRYVLSECVDLLQKYQNILTTVEQMQGKQEVTISVAMPLGTLLAVDYHLFDDFEQEHPTVNISYNEYTDAAVSAAFQEDKYDLYFSATPLEKKGVTSEKLISHPVYLCIPTTHPLYREETITLELLTHHGFAMFTEDFQLRRNFVRVFEQKGYTPIIQASSRDYNALKDLAYYENLLFITAGHSRRPDVGFRYVPFPSDDFTWDIWLVRNVEKSDKWVDMLCQYIKDSL